MDSSTQNQLQSITRDCCSVYLPSPSPSPITLVPYAVPLVLLYPFPLFSSLVLYYHISFIRYQFLFIFLQTFSQPIKISCSVLLRPAVLYIFHLPPHSNSCCSLCSSSCIFTSLSLLFKFCIITSLSFAISSGSFSFNLSLSQSKSAAVYYSGLLFCISSISLSPSNSSCSLCSSACTFTSHSLLFKFCIITSLSFAISSGSFSFNLSLSQSKSAAVYYSGLLFCISSITLSNSSCSLCSSSCTVTSLSLLFKFCIITFLSFAISSCSFSFNLSQSKSAAVHYSKLLFCITL